MSEKEKKILETFGKVLPDLSEAERAYLMGLGEGMAIKTQTVPEEKADA